MNLNEFFNNSLELNIKDNEKLRQLVDLPYSGEIIKLFSNIINTDGNSSLSNDLLNKLYNYLIKF